MKFELNPHYFNSTLVQLKVLFCSESSDME